MARGAFPTGDIVPEASSHPTCHVSVPGRTELAGNHQDHQGGCVIAAAIDRRVCCDVSRVGGSKLYVESEGYEPFSIELDDATALSPHEEEMESTKAIVRGMMAQLTRAGIEVCGCKLSFSSQLPAGFGLSSSAAFELCCGAALLAAAGVPDVSISPLRLAKMALDVERDYYGKPCGIMDQVTCACGGVLHMDFLDRRNPQITPLDLPPSWDEYAYLLVKCPSGHADSSADYAQIALDMQEVADFLGVTQLRDTCMKAYLEALPRVQAKLGDLAALRGFAFFREFDLVRRRLEALCADDMRAFARLSRRSCVCSAEYLQNVGLPGKDEGAMVALALCRELLDRIEGESGGLPSSARIHGGGFGGTIQVIVPLAFSDEFARGIEGLLGAGSCMGVRLGAPGITVTWGDEHAAG